MKHHKTTYHQNKYKQIEMEDNYYVVYSETKGENEIQYCNDKKKRVVSKEGEIIKVSTMSFYSWRKIKKMMEIERMIEESIEAMGRQRMEEMMHHSVNYDE